MLDPSAAADVNHAICDASPFQSTRSFGVFVVVGSVGFIERCQDAVAAGKLRLRSRAAMLRARRCRSGPALAVTERTVRIPDRVEAFAVSRGADFDDRSMT